MSNHIKLIEKRRSITKLKKTNNLNQEEVFNKIQLAIKHSPSAFNAQSVSAVVLFNQEHSKFWEEVLNQILPFVPEGKEQNSISKIDGFKQGDGTIIFLEDKTVSEKLKNRFPLYQDNVALWADQGQGFAQYAVWLMLTDCNLFASLQHYNPLINDYIYNQLKIESHYDIVAQMPFGSADEIAVERKDKDINNRVFKKD
jgi:uncharacterized protein